MFDNEGIRETKPAESSLFNEGDRFSALSALSSSELFSRSESQEIHPVAPNSAPLSFDAISMDQNDDDEFGAFETSTAPAPIATPITSSVPTAPLEEVIFKSVIPSLILNFTIWQANVFAPKNNLSISGMLEEFEASGEPTKKPPPKPVGKSPGRSCQMTKTLIGS